IAEVRAARGGVDSLKKGLRGLSILRQHYEDLQNELFPLFERYSPRHACVRLMWSIEDDVLGLLDSLIAADPSEGQDFWNRLGAFYLAAASLVYRERWILFPAAFAALPDEARSQAAGAADAQGATGAAGALLRTSTGALNASELKAIFSALPVDISFVGADDRLKFFSDPPGRIFPRSPASIGRLVRDCHPPKSLDKVMQIIESFKKGERNEAEFWLKARGSFVHIRYAAIRDEKGTYLGTLETSQDIGRLRTLEGEKRLL
ncbi:MAG TPA: PAS domain-containing protein, partial [Rectinemataceae bacterium]